MNFTQLASDSFTGTDLATLGANWDDGYTGYAEFRITSNQVSPHDAVNFDNAGVTVMESYNAVTWPNDQYAEIQLVNVRFCSLIGTVVRVATPPTLTYYWGNQSIFDGTGANSEIELAKSVAGSFTSLASDVVTTWSAGDMLRTAVLGTGLYLFQNGVEVLSASDSAISSGRAGLVMLFFGNCSGHNGQFMLGDNWAGGSVADDVTALPHHLMLLGVGR